MMNAEELKIWPFSQAELNAAIQQLRDSKIPADIEQQAVDSIVMHVRYFIRKHKKYPKYQSIMNVIEGLYKDIAFLKDTHFKEDIIGHRVIDELSLALANFCLLFPPYVSKVSKPGKKGPKDKTKEEQKLVYALALISSGNAWRPETKGQINWKFVKLCMKPLERLELWTWTGDSGNPNSHAEHLKSRLKAAAKSIKNLQEI
jgi:hypothetical protein